MSFPTVSICCAALPVDHRTLLLAVVNAAANTVFVLQAISEREF